MPCYFPMQASSRLRDDGKKDVTFSNALSRIFSSGKPYNGEGNLVLPCGRCMGCRLERSRQWALRCLHESKLYDDNCFITLTYREGKLPPGGSLIRKDVQDFLKRLRRANSDVKIRVFYCGEYGENFERPHYHLCLFNFDFKDKVFWKDIDGFKYFISNELSFLWDKGFSTISDLTFESAAYVARYCTKKISGPMADSYYAGRVPEFGGASLKPGIGAGWLEEFGETDVFPHDECIVNGVRCGVPRYYDILWERKAPEQFAKAKARRLERAGDMQSDNTFDRLAVKMKCHMARVKNLVRKLEI